MKVKGIEKIESRPDVNIFLKKPFVSSDKREQHGSNRGFQGTLNESIEELLSDDETYIEDDHKEEDIPRRIQLMELKRARINIEQLKNNDEINEEKTR